MKTNKKAEVTPKYTHGGARAADHVTPVQQLRRLVMSCLLFEDQFYIDGKSSADLIHEAADKVPLVDLANIAVEARTKFNLRHVPLWLLVKLIERGRGNAIVSDTIVKTIQRADEMAELLSLYWKNGRKPLAKQLQRGLAAAFVKFDAYQLAKYNRDDDIKLRDVLFLCHAKPKDAEQAAVWKKLVDKELESPDTWEVSLSAGADKRETFTRLIGEGKLGYLALLRNLRNMHEAGVDKKLVNEAIKARCNGADRVLPVRFFAAAQEAPQFEKALDNALCAGIAKNKTLSGRTLVILDVSGSMDQQMSGRSTMSRMDAGAALAAVIRGACEDATIYATAGNDFTRLHATAEVPARDGMALRDVLKDQRKNVGGGGIFLKPMLDFVQSKESVTPDRIVVITDEQDCAVSDKDRPSLAKPFGKTANYLINVGAYKNGVGYGPWTHIDGLSEHIVDFILENERQQTQE